MNLNLARRSRLVATLAVALLLLSMRELSIATPAVKSHLASTPTAIVLNGETARFAVIGDYGDAGPPEQAVADLVKSWNPDFIITTGDNNYRYGAAATIDANIGQYYHEFISPYKGSYGPGAAVNRFFPSLGNHDWYTAGAAPYLEYFTLPGNERYYDFTWGPLHVFALDSDPNEPDGVTSTSTQALWLRDGLAASTSCWDLVYFHHPPFSSGKHGSIGWMQWPFPEWGADAVLAGHDHVYERIDREGFPYFVDGLGGRHRYEFQTTPVTGSQVRYNDNWGAMLVVATRTEIVYTFVAINGSVVDTYTQTGGCLDVRTPTATSTAVETATPTAPATPTTGSPTPGATRTPTWTPTLHATATRTPSTTATRIASRTPTGTALASPSTGTRTPAATRPALPLYLPVIRRP
ncbi:MAG TPA: metallophosphoesterase [Ardenticatenaceae bacterium]|nr:metallophosphoesterase [Ardenticatenaceae bacterium]